MKLVFNKDDSIYKIFTTIEKLHYKKTVNIFIHEENIIFNNVWFAKQLLGILESKKLNYCFSALNNKQKVFFESVWIKYEIKEEAKVLKVKKYFFSIFWQAKKYHLIWFRTQKYTFYLILLLETIALGYVLYFFYNLISPQANIFLKPTFYVEEMVYNFRFYPSSQKEIYENTNHISVPYYTWNLSYEYSIYTTVDNIKYIENPSKWVVTVYNELEKNISLKANTVFSTQNWLLFRSKNWINIPPKKWDSLWYTKVELIAMDKDKNDEIIWYRWNIEEWSTLYIDKLKESIIQKKVFAEAEKDFKWWETIWEWTVTEKDIEIIQNKLKEYIEKNKSTIIEEQFLYDDRMIISNIDNIWYDVHQNIVNANIGDKKANVEWKIKVSLYFDYIEWNDLLEWIQKYIKQRISSNLILIDIDKNSLTMYEKYDYKSIYSIPTKINIIWWYNFNEDINGFINEILTKIVWQKKSEAEKVILWYDEISTVVIKMNPSWYDILPDLKSRINIEIIE